VKDNVNKAVETAKVHISKVTDKPEVQEFAKQAQEGFKKAAEGISGGAKLAAKKIDETMNSPQVQEAIVKAKNTAAGLFNSAVGSIQSLFGKKEEAAEEEKIEISVEDTEEADEKNE
jgi:hypothetical protein